jgi:hypothetical protein
VRQGNEAKIEVIPSGIARIRQDNVVQEINGVRSKYCKMEPFEIKVQFEEI